jgi:hypothetical protein
MALFFEDLVSHGLLRERRPLSLLPNLASSALRIASFPFRIVFAWIAPPLKVKLWFLLGLAWLSFRSFGWSKTIRAWRGYFDSSRHPPTSRKMSDPKSLDEVVREVAASHILRVGCKERALCCWSLLHSAGIRGHLVIGVTLYPFAAHCWCESDSNIIGDIVVRCESFTPVLRYL